jgi:hypothetical protein
MNGGALKFTGTVQSINVKGSGPKSAQLLFSLIARDGAKKPLVVHTDTDTRAFCGMVSVLATAMQLGAPVDATYYAATPTDKATEIEVKAAR